jgi:hypothetical protein
MADHSELLHALSQGIDIRTGEQLPSGHILNDPDVIRALHAAVLALRKHSRRELRKKNVNQGTSWTQEEEARLTHAFSAGKNVQTIAQDHGRTKAAINSRLRKLGLLE